MRKPPVKEIAKDDRCHLDPEVKRSVVMAKPDNSQKPNSRSDARLDVQARPIVRIAPKMVISSRNS